MESKYECYWSDAEIIYRVPAQYVVISPTYFTVSHKLLYFRLDRSDSFWLSTLTPKMIRLVQL